MTKHHKNIILFTHLCLKAKNEIAEVKTKQRKKLPARPMDMCLHFSEFFFHSSDFIFQLVLVIVLLSFDTLSCSKSSYIIQGINSEQCYFEESDNALLDLYWISGDISFERAHKPEHFRFPVPMPNWHLVSTYVTGLPCLMRTMLTCQKVCQV